MPGDDFARPIPSCVYSSGPAPDPGRPLPATMGSITTTEGQQNGG